MAKKTLLRLEFDSPFKIVGIFCLEKDYRFCWMMNSFLGFDFHRVTDFAFTPEKITEEQNYSLFSFQNEEAGWHFFLLSNRSAEGVNMFSKPPGINFLLLIKADAFRYDFNKMLKDIRSLKSVTAAFLLDEALGKKKDEFLYDFEYFITHDKDIKV